MYVCLRVCLSTSGCVCVCASIPAWRTLAIRAHAHTHTAVYGTVWLRQSCFIYGSDTHKVGLICKLRFGEDTGQSTALSKFFFRFLRFQTCSSISQRLWLIGNRKSRCSGQNGRVIFMCETLWLNDWYTFHRLLTTVWAWMAKKSNSKIASLRHTSGGLIETEAAAVLFETCCIGLVNRIIVIRIWDRRYYSVVMSLGQANNAAVAMIDRL